MVKAGCRHSSPSIVVLPEPLGPIWGEIDSNHIKFWENNCGRVVQKGLDRTSLTAWPSCIHNINQ
jgi:hypothetical protein